MSTTSLGFVRHSLLVIRHPAAAVLALCFFLQSPSAAADWPQLFGPQRNGAADESEIAIQKSSQAEPKLVWEKDLGSGHSGPVVAGGKVIIFHRTGNQAVVEALDVSNGDEVWSFRYTTDYRDSFGFDNGPRGCPAVGGGKVILHGAEGMVHALDLKTGKMIWKYNTVLENQSPQGFFGRACSPIIIGKHVFITPGGNAGLVSLALEDGNPAWHSVEDEASYSSPVMRARGDGADLVCWLRNNLVVCDAADGKIVFSERFRSEMGASVNAALPIFCGGDRFFVSAGYGVGGVMWKWGDGGKLTKLWQKSDALDSHYGTPVFYKDHLYGFHGRQEQGQTLRCIRASNGEVTWESEHVPGGTLLRVKDILVVLTEAGELWLVEAVADKFNKISATQVLRAGHRAHAAYANGVWFGRDAKRLVAMRLAAP